MLLKKNSDFMFYCIYLKNILYVFIVSFIMFYFMCARIFNIVDKYTFFIGILSKFVNFQNLKFYKMIY